MGWLPSFREAQRVGQLRAAGWEAVVVGDQVIWHYVGLQRQLSPQEQQALDRFAASQAADDAQMAAANELARVEAMRRANNDRMRSPLSQLLALGIGTDAADALQRRLEGSASFYAPGVPGHPGMVGAGHGGVAALRPRASPPPAVVNSQTPSGTPQQQMPPTVVTGPGSGANMPATGVMTGRGSGTIQEGSLPGTSINIRDSSFGMPSPQGPPLHLIEYFGSRGFYVIRTPTGGTRVVLRSPDGVRITPDRLPPPGTLLPGETFIPPTMPPTGEIPIPPPPPPFFGPVDPGVLWDDGGSWGEEDQSAVYLQQSQQNNTTHGVVA